MCVWKHASECLPLIGMGAAHSTDQMSTDVVSLHCVAFNGVHSAMYIPIQILTSRYVCIFVKHRSCWGGWLCFMNRKNSGLPNFTLKGETWSLNFAVIEVHLPWHIHSQAVPSGFISEGELVLDKPRDLIVWLPYEQVWTYEPFHRSWFSC